MWNKWFSIKTTADGSPTLFSAEADESYHSMHGAYTESMRVFIELGLRACIAEQAYIDEVKIVEAGFGTGLNALLSLAEALSSGTRIYYIGYELYPLAPEIYQEIDFAVPGLKDAASWLRKLHDAPWDTDVQLTPLFRMRKCRADITQAELPKDIDVVYWDAFSPETQPEMWASELLQRVFDHCHVCSVFTTYCAKGDIRRRLEAVGFEVERMAGPEGGKREVLRASKPHIER